MKSTCNGLRTGQYLGKAGALALFGLLCAVAVGVTAQTPVQTDPWAQWRFILGDWGSEPDTSGVEGGTSFSLDLDGMILVRKNFANYPATKDKPTINHKDLMVIHQNGKSADADYWDNEGHAIHYVSRFSDNADTLQFISSIVEGAPRFRLSYVKLGADSLRVGFEAAPPGKPEGFKPYLSGFIHRK